MFEELCNALMKDMTLKQDCEYPDTTYLCVGDIRLIFRDGKYIGWYRP